MKKIVLLAFMSLCSITSYSQKTKVKAKKTTVTAVPKGAFAKADNLVAENKAGNFQLTIDGSDAIVIKSASNFNPTDVKLKAFTAKGVKLYLLSWTEKTQSKTDLKTEDITTIYSNVYEISTKKQVISNAQITKNSTEKVFLDRLKNASETQQRVRKEGYEFTLNPDGSINLKTKSGSTKYVYNPTSAEFE